MKINFKSGQLILESLIAIGITSLVLVSLLAAITRGVKNTSNASQISQASSYAREGIEIARSARDQADSWEEFKTDLGGATGGDECLNSNLVWNDCNCSITSPTPNIDNIFFRCVKFEADGDDKRKVTVTVSWQESGGTRQVQATTFLTDWKR